MYAIFVDGGRQYKVVEGQELEVDYRDVPSGETVKFEQVLAYSDGSKLNIGTPTVGEHSITAKVLGIFQAEKLTVQKFRRRKTFRKRTGHRQLQTKIQIDNIHVG